jgi:predicted ATPase with chaperone activity
MYLLERNIPVEGAQDRSLMKECSCTTMAIARYQKEISGPLLDRIDIHVEVPRVDYKKLADKRNRV